VNDRAELVAIVSHFDKTQREASGNIDVAEVRAVLKELAERDGWEWKDPPTVPFSEEDIDDPAQLAARLNDPSADTRLGAARHLADLGADANPAAPALVAKLDDPDERVRATVADALAKTGPPAPADVSCLARAVQSGGPNARQYALRFYADPIRKLPEASVPDVVAALADPSAETRKLAVLVLGNYGPGCKRQAFAALFERVADDDPAVAAEAAKVLDSFAPLDDADRAVLVKNLAHEKPLLRLLAVQLLTPAAPDAATALKWFRPRLSDDDPRVRAKAVAGIAKWGPAAKDAMPELRARTRDANPETAAAPL